MGTRLVVQINVTLTLPRDEATLPLTRHIAKHCLEEIGVEARCRADVALAMTEACANVVQHSQADDLYEVRFRITDEVCEISVVDTGHGFDHGSLSSEAVSGTAESGRGITLMHALVDHVKFESRPEAGTVVHLVKTLEFDPGAAAERLRSAPSED